MAQVIRGITSEADEQEIEEMMAILILHVYPI
jgi:hypothetical protein